MLRILFHDHFVWIFSSYFGYQSILFHYPLYLLVIHGGNPHLNVSPTIFALTLVKNLFDFEIIGVIFAWLIRVSQPFIISGSGNTRQFTKNSYITL